MNDVKCELCGKYFQQITSTHLKKEHNITFDEYKNRFPDSKTLADKSREKISSNAKQLNEQGKIGFKKNHKVNLYKKPWNKDLKGCQVSWSKGKTKNDCPSLKRAGEKLSKKRKQMFKEGKLPILKGDKNPMFGKHITDEHKKALWNGWKNCYTKPELKIIEILKDYKEWEYVGDGKYYLKTRKQYRIPDFINKKQRKIIEVYGDYWHKNENIDDKISEYKEIGWECVIIWESEIMKDDFTLENIKWFL